MFERGTIKHACYALLLGAGAAGMTTSSIVDRSRDEGHHNWGAAKTPENSVVAALCTVRVCMQPVVRRLYSDFRLGWAYAWAFGWFAVPLYGMGGYSLRRVWNLFVRQNLHHPCHYIRRLIENQEVEFDR